MDALDQIRYKAATQVVIDCLAKVSRDQTAEEERFSTYHQLGFDSLDCVEFLMEVEKVASVSIPDEQAEELMYDQGQPNSMILWLVNNKQFKVK